jgi:hypothetical protein
VFLGDEINTRLTWRGTTAWSAWLERMLELHKKLAAEQTHGDFGRSQSAEHVKTVLQRQIEATDRQIDALVYELYGLTEEEINVVERAGQ